MVRALIVGFLTVLVLTLVGSAAAETVSFGAASNFGVGTGPQSVAIGDLDGDGVLDLVVANVGSGTVSVLRGTGGGTFAAPTNFPVGTNPAAVAIADLNRDGKPDLVVVNHVSDDVSVLLGDGTGSFGTATNFAVGDGPLFVAIADLNGDGKPDLAVANFNSNNVSVLLGDGMGSFGTATNFPVGTSARALAIADLNGDGKLDLAVANANSDNVSILLGDGTGSFGTATNFAAGSAPESVAIGDLNGDGKLDLAVANLTTNTVSVLLGTGTGLFAAATNFAVGASPRFVAIGDLNGDGKLDLAVANASSSNVSVLPGTGTGSFGAATDFTVGIAPFSVAIGDLNGDGKPDLAVANDGSAYVSVLLNTTAFTPSGTLATSATFGTGLEPRSIAVADLNRDGKLDLVIGNSSADTVSVLLGDGLGGFGASVPFSTGSVPADVAIGDFDRDGKLDIAVANSYAGTISILLGNGLGGLGTKTDFTVGGRPEGLAVGDLNGDGNPDLAVANFGLDTVSILLGNGTGGFAPKTDFTTGDGPVSIAIADLNRDGKLDLVVANWFADTVSVLRGNGDGTFAPKTDFTTGDGPVSIAIADLNRDGKLDLVTANVYDNTVSVLRGDGLGGFPTRTDFATGSGPESVVIEDFNRDGKLDLAVASDGGSSVTILLGDGLGGFATRTDIAGINTAFAGAAGDFNRDGRVDLAVTNSGPDTVTILLNQGVAADLSVTKTDSPDPATVGSPLTYTITVTNNGPSPATGVTLTDPLPATTIFGAFTPSQGSCSGTTTITCNLGTIASGSSATVTIVVTPTSAGAFSNTATVAANEPDTNLANNSATAVTTATTAGATVGFVSGRVTQADGVTPIQGATVIADPNPGTFGSAVTAADGTYTITGVATGSYRVRAQAAGFGTRWYNGKTNFSSADLVAVTAGATTTGIDFALPAGAGGFSGRVTQDGGGTGIPNAGVSVHQAATGTFVLFVTADGNGYYTTGLTLDPGSYKAQAQKDGFVNRWFDGVATIGAATAITVNASSDNPGVNFLLPTGAGGIRGRVRHADTGAPLAGVIVDVFDSGTNSFVVGGFRTAGDGTYATGLRLDPGRSYKVRAKLTGFVETFHVNGVDFASATPVVVTGGTETNNIDIAMPAGGTISGTIRDLNPGDPIAGANVFAFRFRAATFFGTFTVQADQNGNFTLQGLRDGDWVVRAEAPGHFVGYFSGDPNTPATDSETATPISISGANTFAGANITLRPGGGGIQGRITRSDGPVAAGTTVYVRGLFPRLFLANFVTSTLTDGDGNYSFQGLAPGQYVVEAQPRQTRNGTAVGWYPTGATSRGTALPVGVTDGATTTGVDFAVTAFSGEASPRTISGTVKDYGSVPLAFAGVGAFDPSTQTVVRFVFVRGDGSYTLDGLAPGQYLLRAETERTYEARAFDDQLVLAAGALVDVSAGDVGGKDFFLPPTAGTLTGWVTDADGQPILGAAVSVRNFFENSVGGAATRADGSYLVRGLPAGFYKVRVSAPGFVTRYFTSTALGGGVFDEGSFVEVIALQERADINVALDSNAGAISGMVTRSDTGEPVVGAVVNIREAATGASVHTVVTAADGSYVAHGLASGSYKVHVIVTGLATQWYSGRDTREAADVVTVTAAGTTTGINFVLSPSQGSISGRVFMSDGAIPLPGAGIIDLRISNGYIHQSLPWKLRGLNA